MSGRTKIEWADAVWNPVTGCTKVSEGCRNCYAERMARRLAGRLGYPADEPFRVTLHPERLAEPLRWRKPRRIFVCSMGDLFHEDVPDAFIAQVWHRMHLAQEHTFLVLTKRADRMRSWVSHCGDAQALGWITHNGTPPAKAYAGTGIIVGTHRAWPLANVWLGVSAEDQRSADERIPLLLDTPAAVRFVSCEPLLGPVDLYGGDPDPRLGGTVAGRGLSLEPFWLPEDDPSGPPRPCVTWVIAGGESGPGARPCHPDWVRSLRDQCQAADVPFFFKQWGEYVHVAQMTEDCHRAVDAVHNLAGHGQDFWGVGKKAAGRELDGRTWDEMPEHGGKR